MIDRVAQKAGMEYRREFTAGTIITMAYQTVALVATIIAGLFWLSGRFATIDVTLAQIHTARIEIDRRLQEYDVSRRRLDDARDAIADIKGDLKEIRAWIGKRSEAPVSPTTAPPTVPQQGQPPARPF